MNESITKAKQRLVRCMYRAVPYNVLPVVEDATLGLLDFFKPSLKKQVADFYKANQDWASARTTAQVEDFFSRHPGWRQIPSEVRRELAKRVTDKTRCWVVYDVQHAFEILAFTTEISDALTQNFIPICNDKSNTVEARLYLMSMTFSRLAFKFVDEMVEHGHRLPPKQAADGLEDAKAFAEASLICDRYCLTSFIPAALAWVYKNSDFDKALAIADEGIKWGAEMRTARPHATSLFDEQFIKSADEPIGALKAVRHDILSMKTTVTPR